MQTSQIRSFQGMRALPSLRPARAVQIIVASTTAFLVAGRFGLAPTANAQASSGLTLQKTDASGLTTGDPAGFTAVDVLGHGVLGHIVGVGIILGLKATGAL